MTSRFLEFLLWLQDHQILLQMPVRFLQTRSEGQKTCFRFHVWGFESQSRGRQIWRWPCLARCCPKLWGNQRDLACTLKCRFRLWGEKKLCLWCAIDLPVESSLFSQTYLAGPRSHSLIWLHLQMFSLKVFLRVKMYCLQAGKRSIPGACSCWSGWFSSSEDEDDSESEWNRLSAICI